MALCNVEDSEFTFCEEYKLNVSAIGYMCLSYSKISFNGNIADTGFGYIYNCISFDK